MKYSIVFCYIVLSILPVFNSFGHKNGFPELKGSYLGQKPPGMTPELFAPGIITTEYHEHSSPAFSKEGKEVYWSVFINFWGPQVILYMQQKNGIWAEPEVAPFSGQYSDGNPCFSPDGQKLFFESRRPSIKGDPYTGNTDIWVVHRTDTGWSEPENLGIIVNSDKWERGPSVSSNGNLYFCSWKEGGFGESDIYVCRFENGNYSKPENLGNIINTKGYESFPFIAPDESYLIYESDSDELFISIRRSDNSWSIPENLSEKLNSTHDRFPLLSNDGKYFFFVSNRWLGNPYFNSRLNLRQVKEKAKSLSNALGNVFWVDAKIIDQFKPKINKVKYR